MISLTTLAANQIIVHHANGSTLFSYDTPICTKHLNGKVTLYPAWRYSPITSKYRSKFLNGETTKITALKLVTKKYVLKEDFYELCKCP